MDVCLYWCLSLYVCVCGFLHFRSSFPQASPLAVVQQNQFATKNDDEKEDGDEEQSGIETRVLLKERLLMDGFLS